jgi:carbonic anhydrase/acetyltransferase-like protein (isoleucine patch superfamily)
LTLRPFAKRQPRCGNAVYIDPSAIIIGDVTFGDDASVWPLTVIRGDVNRIVIGAATNVQDSSVLHVTHASERSPGGFALSIGNEVTIGHRAVIHGCSIGDRCLIGIGAIIMDGAVLEERVLLGAGSLVPPGKLLESAHLYVGSPARKIRRLAQQELDFLAYSAHHYVNLKNRHLADAAGKA